MASILVVDDEKNMCMALKILLEGDGYTVRTAETGMQALKEVQTNERVDLIISDLRMPDVDGIELLHRLQQQGLKIPLILITAYGSIEVAVEAMKKGATDFITKPFNKDVIRHIVRKTLERSIDQKGRPAFQQTAGDGKVVYKSPVMDDIMKTVRKVSRVQTPLLVTGESGVGKEVIARAVHRFGAASSDTKRSRPYVTISCPAIPETLLASELFGYQKGAFSGASKDYQGKLRMANGGTLLLDEIGDLPLDVQPRLLRFLEQKTFQPLGGNSTVTVEARIICATNRDLGEMVRSGAFREDLYYRINAITIKIPPLRERREDILPLTNHFIDKYNRETGKSVRRASPEVLDAFMAYNWPGNVRELRNIIERAVVLSNDSNLEVEDIPAELFEAEHSAETASLPDTKGARLQETEMALIQRALERNRWNVTTAARDLGITRNTLRYRMNKYGIHKNPRMVENDHQNG
jgi:DNA-binding NtrC family response regulator